MVCSRDGMEVLGFIGKVVSLSAESGRAGAVCCNLEGMEQKGVIECVQSV